MPTAGPFLPKRKSLASLRTAAQFCRGCDLYKGATQAVFGEGKSTASVMLVGEKPGDQEDLSGHPFVGPAGKLLDRALGEAGIARADVYITNAVKHFKYVLRGKRRIHQKPKSIVIAACRPWLEAELALVKPKIIVCLGRTAAQIFLGRTFRVTTGRGKLFAFGNANVIATLHPSALLRIEDEDERKREFHKFVRDLSIVRKRLKARR